MAVDAGLRHCRYCPEVATNEYTPICVRPPGVWRKIGARHDEAEYEVFLTKGVAITDDISSRASTVNLRLAQFKTAWNGRRFVSCVAVAWALAFACPTAASAQESETPPVVDAAAAPVEQAHRSSPWLLVPVVSSSPKLGTSFGGLGAFLHKFDPLSRVSVFGLTYQYTSTHSTVAGAFARTSFGADHHRIVGIAGFGFIKNNYEDYLGSGQPLKTNDDLKALAGRYLYRLKGDWFVGVQGNAANYQVLGESAEDDLALETLGVRGFESASVGVVVMQDSRDSEDMPTQGWYLNLNNLAYREALGGALSFDSYRADLRGFWRHGGGHVLAFRQNNWLTSDAPLAAQAAVILRGYKLGEYLAPYMSSFEAEERLSFGARWGATLFAGVAGLYGESDATSINHDFYPTVGGGVHFVIKPDQRMLVNFEYAQGIEGNRGVFLKFGYGW